MLFRYRPSGVLKHLKFSESLTTLTFVNSWKLEEPIIAILPFSEDKVVLYTFLDCLYLIRIKETTLQNNQELERFPNLLSNNVAQILPLSNTLSTESENAIVIRDTEIVLLNTTTFKEICKYTYCSRKQN